MLLVPSYLAPSAIEGLGVFTPLPIAAGTLLWKFEPRVDWRLSAQEIEQLPEGLRARVRHHCYRDRRGFYVLGGDNTKYMNHSDTPNCVDVDDDHVRAGRDIGAGEELTCDYRSFDLDSATVNGPLF